MSTKLPAFVLGAVLGGAIAAVFFLTRSHSPVPPADTLVMATGTVAAEDHEAALTKARQRLAKLEADNLQLGQRVQELMQQADVAATRPAKKAGPANPFAAMFGDEDSESGKAMKGVMEAAMRQQFDGKIGLMKSKLSLTPEQEASVRAIHDKQLAQSREMASKMFGGKLSKAELADLGKEAGDPEAQIKALLTPEQQTAYEQMQEEERVNNARLIANSELLQMQNTLGLDQAQQDQVFAVLYEQTHRQFSGGDGQDSAAVPNASDFRGVMQRKLEALKGVLTDEQLERYGKQQEQQVKMMEALLPKDGTLGDAVIPHVQILNLPPKP